MLANNLAPVGYLGQMIIASSKMLDNFNALYSIPVHQIDCQQKHSNNRYPTGPPIFTSEYDIFNNVQCNQANQHNPHFVQSQNHQ